MFGADARIVEASGNALCVEYLTVFILQQVAECSMQYAGFSGDECGGVLTQFHTCPTSFYADEFHLLGIREGIEHTDGIATTAHTRRNRIWQASCLLYNLLTCLDAYDGLVIAYDTWIGMRPDR